MSETDIDPGAGAAAGEFPGAGAAGKTPLFWRIMRVLIILYAAGFAAFLLAMLMRYGFGGMFRLRALERVDGVWSFLVWLWNGGTIGIVLLTLSAIAWAVVWQRAAGRPARRLERWYAVVATGWFAISAGLITWMVVADVVRGNTYMAVDILQEGGGFVAVTNAPALIIGAYAIWPRRRP